MSTAKKDQKSGSQESSESRKEQSSKLFEGKLVSITNEKLVMTSKGGQEYTHALAKNAQLKCDGTACKAEDLKAGSRIRATPEPGSRDVVACVEALDQKTDFAECSN